MKKTTLLLLLLLVTIGSSGQVIYEEFNSTMLGESRQLKIQLPRNYDENTEKVYPIVIVLDGDYLFEPVAGNVDYFSFWEDMPESIVVGIIQGESRYEDCAYDESNFLPADKGADFLSLLA